MKIAVIPEAEQIQFQRLAFHHDFIRHIGNIKGCKVRLSGNRAKACKFWTVKLDKIIVVWMLIDECFQHLWVIVVRVLGVLVAQQGHAICFFFGSTGHVRISFLSIVFIYFRSGSSTPFAKNAACRSRHVPQTPHGFSPPS